MSKRVNYSALGAEFSMKPRPARELDCRTVAPKSEAHLRLGVSIAHASSDSVLREFMNVLFSRNTTVSKCTFIQLARDKLYQFAYTHSSISGSVYNEYFPSPNTSRSEGLGATTATRGSARTNPIVTDSTHFKEGSVKY